MIYGSRLSVQPGGRNQTPCLSPPPPSLFSISTILKFHASSLPLTHSIYEVCETAKRIIYECEAIFTQHCSPELFLALPVRAVLEETLGSE